MKYFIVTIAFILFYGCTNKNYIAYTEPSYEQEYKQPMKDSENMHRATLRSYVVKGIRYYPRHYEIGTILRGIASWYGHDFHNKLTSNGETYNMYDITAAHKTLPMNTMVEVKNLLNGKKLIVRINDRGPFIKTRIIDISKTGSSKLGFSNNGTTPVRLRILGYHGQIGTTYKYKSKVKKIKYIHPKAKKITKKFVRNSNNVKVQVASFSNYDGARIFQREFTLKNPQTKSVINFDAKTNLYKVQIENIGSYDDAKEFIQMNNIRGFVVKK